jgi:hypothetical protein
MKAGAGVIVALALCAASPVPAVAQDNEALRGAAVGARDLMLENIQLMICGGAACAPATPEELASPPVTDDEAYSVATIGLTSGAAEFCGLDWEGRSFLPMMVRWRAVEGISDRKLALIGATHGFIQGQTLTALQSRGDCDDQMRAAAQGLLDQTRD